jgi:hypothetical protein
MKYRKLRIAWSVAWGIVAVLLIALWVRSYWVYDVAFFPGSHNFASMKGWLTMDEKLIAVGDVPNITRFRHDWGGLVLLSISGNLTPAGVGRYCPHWVLLVVIGQLAGLSWLPWWSNRFSLRTLLIATTFVAVGLGLIVWLTR